MPPASAYGFDIEAEVPLARLRAAPGVRGTIQVRLAEPGSIAPLESELLGVVEDAGDDVAAALARAPHGVVSWFRDSGWFLSDPQRGTVVTDACGGHGDLWEHRLLSTAIPILLAERGDLVLHASAVVVDGGALILCGSSGNGKSTLAHALARGGCDTIGDDGVALDVSGAAPLVWAGPHGVRLRDAALEREGGKRLILKAPRPASETLPPLALVVLEPRHPDCLELGRLDGAAALLALTPHLTYAGVDRLETALAAASRAIERVPVYRCRMPDSLDQLDAAADELVRRVTAGAEPDLAAA